MSQSVKQPAAPVLPFRAMSGDYNRGLVIICDHASNAIPPELENLGLSAADLERHIAWDVGAAWVAAYLSARFKAPAIFCGVSRLVIDCNRDPADPAAIPLVVDKTPIPGNAHLTVWQKAERMSRWFVPYHNGIEAMMESALATVRDPVLLSVHSMTPELNGQIRTWPVALSSHEDRRLADPMLAALRKRLGFLVGDNEPYGLDPAEDYSVPMHAMRRNLRHLQVEFRQDLIASQDGAAKWAATFGDALKECLPLD
jgi:predicted N-formylglutamate amidohydrolase